MGQPMTSAEPIAIQWGPVKTSSMHVQALISSDLHNYWTTVCLKVKHRELTGISRAENYLWLLWYFSENFRYQEKSKENTLNPSRQNSEWTDLVSLVLLKTFLSPLCSGNYLLRKHRTYLPASWILWPCHTQLSAHKGEKQSLLLIQASILMSLHLRYQNPDLSKKQTVVFSWKFSIQTDVNTALPVLT